MKIAVDAMGGDYAPHAIVEGAIQASQEFQVKVILFGRKHVIAKHLAGFNYDPELVEIFHCSEFAGMAESPSWIFRWKKDASIRVACEQVKSGAADAVVSAGNTGAAVAAAMFIMGRIPGIERPAIAASLPTPGGMVILSDVGANMDSKPTHLVQFAIMSSAFTRLVHGIEYPRVGLLNVGQENSKGNIAVKKAFKLLLQTQLNFIGNVEGKDIFSGQADVIICDGFVGNISLKLTEGLSDSLNDFFSQEFGKACEHGNNLFIKQAFDNFKNRFDYTQYGGAPLLGVNGTVIICHGSSSAKAIKNAIALAISLTAKKSNTYLERMLRENNEQLILQKGQASNVWQQFKDRMAR